MTKVNFKLPGPERKSVAKRSTRRNLRLTKKESQRTKLLATAYELFRRNGFDAVRLEDIAVRAEVSVQTLYNYFHTKRDLLIETLVYCRKQGSLSYERILSAPPPDPIDAVAELLFANAEIIRSPKDKQLWREIFAAVARAHDRERDAFDRNHRSLKIYIRRLLDHFARIGLLAADYPLDVATEVVFAVNAHNVRFLVSSATCTPEEIRERTRAQLQLLWPNNRTRTKGRLVSGVKKSNTALTG